MSRHGFIHDLDEATYHADRDSLSVSGAKTLLKSPAQFKHQQDNPVHSDAFDLGSAAHKMVLGIGAPIEVIAADNWMTKAAKEARDEARANGAIPLLAKDYAVVETMADQLGTHKLASQLLTDGTPEVSAYAIDEPTGVLRRGRFDYLGEGWIADYKTTGDASPAGFASSAARFNYAMQAAWYLDLARACGADVDGFAFVVQSKEAPYLVSVCELDWASEEVGRNRNRRALDLYAACVEADDWPGYPSGLHTISLPRWAFNLEDSHV